MKLNKRLFTCFLAISMVFGTFTNSYPYTIFASELDANNLNDDNNINKKNPDSEIIDNTSPDGDNSNKDKSDTDNPDKDNPDADNSNKDNPDADNSDNGNSDTDNPDKDNPDTNNPDKDNPDTDNPDKDNPDTDNSNKDKSDADNPNKDNSDIDNPDKDKPDTDNPDKDKPDTDNPNKDTPDSDNPDKDKPDSDNSNKDNPDADNPDKDNSDADNPDNDNPDVDNPDKDNPDTNNPNIDNPLNENKVPEPEKKLTTLEMNTSITGNISATLRFDYPQTLESIQNQNIYVTLLQNENTIVKKLLSDISSTDNINGYTVTITAKDIDGIPLNMSSETIVYYFDISISNLPQNTYNIKFEGSGYKTYLSPDIELNDYSRHIIIGTSDSTFTIGDANNDGYINQADMDLVSDALGKAASENLEKYDFNKDGKINVIDIAYVNHQINASGSEKLYETSFIMLNDISITIPEDEILIEGSIENLFKADSDAVTLRTQNEASEVVIPMEFNNSIEMEQIEIISPSGDGAIQNGIVTVEDENGNLDEYSFNNETPYGIYKTERTAGISSVTIELKNRVAVKKITIRVTKTENHETGKVEFAVVQEIKFLKDIVPENPTPSNTTVRNLKAEEANEQVTLTWSELPNITGYKVKYGTESGNYTDELTVDTTTAVISGLKNLIEYYFIVIPVNGDWTGNASIEVSAIPQPSSPPLAPDQLKVAPMDKALKISWEKAKNATYYKVYYRINSEGNEFALADAETNEGKITETSKIIGNLTNDIEYEIYIISGNSSGESKPSLKTVGTPTKESIDKPEGIPDGNIPNDNIESVTMTFKENWDRDSYPNGFDVNNVIDGDYSTHWSARAWWESSEFTYSFKEPKEMNYLIYVPRLDGKYRNSLDKYTIKVDTGDGNFITVANGQKVRNNPAETGFAILPFEKTNVKQIKVSVAQWAGSPTNISLSEILFYEYDESKDINKRILDLFENNSFTKLKSNVTSDMISEITTSLSENKDYLIDSDVLLDELNLAKGLLEGNDSVLGVIHNGIYSRSGLQPLGVAAKAGNIVTIYADIPQGEKVSIVATQYFAEASQWQQTIVTELENGRNVINIPKIGSINTERGGSLYLTYTGNSADNIILHVRRATDIPYLELTDWYTIGEDEKRNRIETYVNELNLYSVKGDKTISVLNSTEISTPNVLLSIPADKVLSALPSDTSQAVEQLYNNVLAWEEIMHISKYTQGIDNTLENTDLSSGRQNIRYMRMFGGAFMYAAGSHVGIGYGSCSGMVKGSPVELLSEGAQSNHLFGWGIAHEIGHNMDKLGKAEITNNIYSLMVQTYDGKDNTLKSRLETSNKYEKLYNKTALGAPGNSNDVFVQLGLYWQIHLAYDDGQNDSNGPMDFYNKFFKEWKNGFASDMSYDDRVAVTASKVAGKNLTEFFTRWGMNISDTAKNEMSSYSNEPRLVWYLNDEARRYRISGGTGISAQTVVNLSAEVVEDKKAKLTFTSDANDSDIIGYEIYKNNKSIAFTTEKEYTDIIGSANNLSFTYTVRVVDKLGNASNMSNPAEIRISYDKTIDETAYTLSNENGTITALMNNVTAITGIKVINAPISGAYEVKIKKSANDNFVVAKSGDFSDKTSQTTDFVTYFNKPGAASSDTRMWTYDAYEIQITGIPDTSKLQFISYPGDNIAFNDISVGRLSADYKYGDASDEVIQSGTLIITGTYRGDPVYNIMQIMGQYISKNQEDDSEEIIERPIDGYALLFAEIPKDGEVSDISDGIFIFVPDVQKEAELQETDLSSCDFESLLPAFIKAELYRTDNPENADSKRLVSDTLWISSPSGDSLPEIKINSATEGIQ